MSWVANLLLSADRKDHDVVRSLSDWLRYTAPWNEPAVDPTMTGVGFLAPLTGKSVNWGGWKYPECSVWGGALNHADLAAVLEHVRSLPWKHPACVQVLIMDQEQSYFRLWMLRDGELQQYAPPPDPSDEMCL